MPEKSQRQSGQDFHWHFLARLYSKGKRPRDKQRKAIEAVIQQAELLSKEWAG